MNRDPAAITRDGEQIDVFYGGPNRHLWRIHWPDTPRGHYWSGGEDLNVEIYSAPAVIWTGQRIEVFYLGSNGHLWRIHWPDTPGGHYWSGGEDLNAAMNSAPGAAWTGQRIEVFYQDADRHLWRVHWPNTSGGRFWSGGEDINAVIDSDPAAIWTGDQLYVVYRKDDHLWQIHWPDTPGGTFWSGGTDLGGSVVSKPALYLQEFQFRGGVDRLLYAIYWGTNGHLWWYSPLDVSPPPIAAPPPPRATIDSFTVEPNDHDSSIGRVNLGEKETYRWVVHMPVCPNPHITLTATNDDRNNVVFFNHIYSPSGGWWQGYDFEGRLDHNAQENSHWTLTAPCGGEKTTKTITTTVYGKPQQQSPSNVMPFCFKAIGRDSGNCFVEELFFDTELHAKAAFDIEYPSYQWITSNFNCSNFYTECQK